MVWQCSQIISKCRLSKCLENTVLVGYTLIKKENQIFLICKEIQNGAVAKSYMTNGLLIQYMAEYLGIASYIRKPFLIYDFATTPF